MTLDEQALKTVLPGVVELRHRLHAWPELGYEEVATTGVIRGELSRLGVAWMTVDSAPTATIAHIGDPSRPCVALRADIDALPIHERTGVAWSSTRPGFMHACGHDGHVAALLGAAALLKRGEAELPRCLKLIFQPAEEGGGGARRLTEAGVLSGRVGPAASRIFGLHGWPGLPVGTVSTRPGPLLAATDTFSATFRGRGCHGAMPHLGRDPIVCAAEAVTSLQHFVSREIDPTEPALITVGMFHAGTTTNVIPDEAAIAGTIRTLNPATRAAAAECVRRRCEATAKAHGCVAQVSLREGYPATINDDASARFIADLARRALGSDRFLPAARPVMGGEDFSYYLEQVAGCFYFVGTCPPGRTDFPPLHSDRYDFTDDALATCIRMHWSVATG